MTKSIGGVAKVLPVTDLAPLILQIDNDHIIMPRGVAAGGIRLCVCLCTCVCVSVCLFQL